MAKRGWDEKEIIRLKKILLAERKRDESVKRQLNVFFYWTMLLVIIILNFMAMLVISPFMIMLESTWLYIFTGGLALLVGLIAGKLIMSVERIPVRHHYFAAAIMPALVIADILLLRIWIGFLSETFSIMPDYSQTVLAIVFSVCFLVPYALLIFFRRQ